MVLASALDIVPHGVHEPVPANLFLAHPPGGLDIALCILEAVSDVLCK
jgi:hypothetical protein